MKFFMAPQSSGMPIPPVAAEELWTAAKAWFATQIDAGTVDCHYLYIGWGGFAAANASSYGEASTLLVEYPLYPFFVWQVKPLCERGQVYDAYIEMMRKLANWPGVGHTELLNITVIKIALILSYNDLKSASWPRNYKHNRWKEGL